MGWKDKLLERERKRKKLQVMLNTHAAQALACLCICCCCSWVEQLNQHTRISGSTGPLLASWLVLVRTSWGQDTVIPLATSTTISTTGTTKLAEGELAGYKFRQSKDRSYTAKQVELMAWAAVQARLWPKAARQPAQAASIWQLEGSILACLLQGSQL